MVDISYSPLTVDRWADFERLFGANGANGCCWCTWWRLSNAEFNQKSGEERKNILRTLVQTGKTPGILAYVDGIPAGWVAVAAREEYARLERSRVLARVDVAPVWSITCFFINKHQRRQGLMAGLIREAAAYARSQGAAIIEAYPIEPHAGSDSGSLYYGVVSVFTAAGFIEVARRSPYHPVMRKESKKENF